MGQLGQAPEKPYHGSGLPQSSVPGKNVDFVQPSDRASGSLSLAASGSADDTGSFEVALTVTVNGRVVQWDKIIAWCYADLYVDSEDVGSTYREGFTLTDAQQRIDMSTKPLLFELGPTPSSYSHITYWSFSNRDASSHTIIGYFQWKYITTA